MSQHFGSMSHHVLACLAAVLALPAAVSARVACVVVAAILAPLQPFRLHVSAVLFAAAVSTRTSMVCLVLPCCLGLEVGFVACHVMTLCVDHGFSATPQLELDYACRSGTSLCVLLCT